MMNAISPSSVMACVPPLMDADTHCVLSVCTDLDLKFRSEEQTFICFSVASYMLIMQISVQLAIAIQFSKVVALYVSLMRQQGGGCGLE